MNSLNLQTGFLAKLIFELQLPVRILRGLRERSHFFGEQLVCPYFYLLRHRYVASDWDAVGNGR